MNKSYMPIKFQNMPRKNLAKNQNAVGPQFCSDMRGVQLHRQSSQSAAQYGPSERKLVCI